MLFLTLRPEPVARPLFVPCSAIPGRPSCRSAFFDRLLQRLYLVAQQVIDDRSVFGRKWGLYHCGWRQGGLLAVVVVIVHSFPIFLLQGFALGVHLSSRRRECLEFSQLCCCVVFWLLSEGLRRVMLVVVSSSRLLMMDSETSMLNSTFSSVKSFSGMLWDKLSDRPGGAGHFYEYLL